jgi:ankyrin repeat protein
MQDEFIRAIFQNDLKRIVRDLNGGRDPNLPDRYGWIPLHRAAASNRARIAQVLLDAGSSLTACGTEEWTPLHLAAVSLSAAAISVFVRAGADPNVPSNRGDTPLHLCVISDKLYSYLGTKAGTKTARLLLRAGASLPLTNREGLSPLTKAEQEQATRMAAFFRRYLEKV